MPGLTPHSRLQIAGVIWLERWMPAPGMIWSVDSAGEADPIAQLWSSRKGHQSGIHDTHTIRFEKFRTFEWKYGRDKPSDTQIAWGAKLLANGHAWHACWSVMDAYEAAVSEWSLPEAARIHAMSLDAKWMSKVSGGARNAPKAGTKQRSHSPSTAMARRKSDLNDPVPDLTAPHTPPIVVGTPPPAAGPGSLLIK